MHYHFVEDASGDVISLIPFCSDACHRAHMGDDYQGWNGCHEGGDTAEFCAHCGTVAGGTYECDCQRDKRRGQPLSTDGERCAHGHWLQVPAHYLLPARRRQT